MMFPLLHGVNGALGPSGPACLTPSGVVALGTPFSFTPVESVAVTDTEVISYRHSGFTMYAHARDGSNVYSQVATDYAGAYGSFNTKGCKATTKEAAFVSGFDSKVRTLRLDAGVLGVVTSSVSASLPSLPTSLAQVSDNFIVGVVETTKRLFLIDRTPTGAWTLQANIDISAETSGSNAINGVGCVGPYILVQGNGAPQAIYVFERTGYSVAHVGTYSGVAQFSNYSFFMPLNERSFILFGRDTVSDTGTFYESFCIDEGIITSNGDLTEIKASQSGFRLSPFNATDLVLVQDGTLETWQVQGV